MKKMMRFVKGKRREGSRDGDQRSESSLGSRSSLAMSASTSALNIQGSQSPSISLSKAPMRLLQSSWSLNQEDESLIDPNSTKLHLAAAKGQLDKIVKHLKKTDVNSQDSGARTALHLAASGGHSRAVHQLLDSGARVDGQDSRGHTALCHAVEAGHLDTVQALVSRGAATDSPDQLGDTSVHLAVKRQARDILGLLLRKGANPDIINYEGQSALHLAVAENDLDSVNILLRNGALVNIRYGLSRLCYRNTLLFQIPSPGDPPDAGGQLW